jgi:hypothetical protein
MWKMIDSIDTILVFLLLFHGFGNDQAYLVPAQVAYKHEEQKKHKEQKKHRWGASQLTGCVLEPWDQSLLRPILGCTMLSPFSTGAIRLELVISRHCFFISSRQ